jgi:vesicle-associated membrane protein 7
MNSSRVSYMSGWYPQAKYWVFALAGRIAVLCRLSDMHRRSTSPRTRVQTSSVAWRAKSIRSRASWFRILVRSRSHTVATSHAHSLSLSLEHDKCFSYSYVDKVLERGGQIEELVQKTAVLDVQSVKFKKQSTALKNKLWWKVVRLCCG